MPRDAFIEKLEQLARSSGDTDALEAEILAMFDAEQNRSELFSKIVTDVAMALGQDVGETTHDLGEKVKALQADQDRRTSRNVVISPRDKIHCAAIRLNDGSIFTGKRHRQALDAAHAIEPDRLLVNRAEHGFVTEEGQFLNRMDAMDLVLRTGQVQEEDLCNPRYGLFSEDLY